MAGLKISSIVVYRTFLMIVFVFCMVLYHEWMKNINRKNYEI